MKSLIYDLMYVHMDTLIKSLIACTIAYLLINPFSKTVEKSTGYNPSNTTSKVFMYIAAVLAMITLILNGVQSPIHASMRALLLISVLGLYAVLVFVNKRSGIVYSLIISLLQVLGSMTYVIMFVICSLFGGAEKRSYNTSGTQKYNGNQTNFDAEIQKSANSYNQQVRQQEQQYAEIEARRLGFNSAQDARESGFNIPEND